jgi:hypothetical protein
MQDNVTAQTAKNSTNGSDEVFGEQVIGQE